MIPVQSILIRLDDGVVGYPVINRENPIKCSLEVVVRFEGDVGEFLILDPLRFPNAALSTPSLSNLADFLPAEDNSTQPRQVKSSQVKSLLVLSQVRQKSFPSVSLSLCVLFFFSQSASFQLLLQTRLIGLTPLLSPTRC